MTRGELPRWVLFWDHPTCQAALSTAEQTELKCGSPWNRSLPRDGWDAFHRVHVHQVGISSSRTRELAVI